MQAPKGTGGIPAGTLPYVCVSICGPRGFRALAACTT
nr:MAG TPA: hypothetical protein [Caudoviricetes sp.]